MPIYDFRCRDCGEHTERELHLEEFERERHAPKRCTRCNGTHVETEISAFEVRTTRKSATSSF